MDSLLEQGFRKKTVYSIISELKGLSTIPSLDSFYTLVQMKPSSIENSSELLKLFCICAWVLNKSKVKQIAENWVSLIDAILLKASVADSTFSKDELVFAEKDQKTFHKVNLIS